MKAARVHRFGPSSVIQIEEVEKPQPEADQVLVEVHAAGVGPWDTWIRGGKSVLPQPLPLTLGSDFSGVVTAIGANVTSWSPGDEVFGITGPQYTGASAEYAAVPQTMLAHKPRGLSHVEAASVPVVAVTAMQMLGEHARVVPGERVLILGAAGAVGAYAVQLARTSDVHVIGTVRRKDEVAYVRSLGAGEVVDVATARMEDVVAPVEVVIDTVGGELANRSMALLSRGGRLVTAVPNPDQALAARYGVSASFMLVDVRTEPLTRIAELFDKRELITNVGEVLPLSDIRAAHEMLERTRPHRRGKIVLALTSDAKQSPVAA
ncbi:MAG: NADP-dependent oxidoreductase [Polyangiaceae bacterium]|nr:NADP-dependent oxidoreductase [Polyangiaceae bacterium]